jgi:hypothetical protein
MNACVAGRIKSNYASKRVEAQSFFFFFNMQLCTISEIWEIIASALSIMLNANKFNELSNFIVLGNTNMLYIIKIIQDGLRWIRCIHLDLMNCYILSNNS